MRNYYEILGLHSSATPNEIRRAYRILARRYHPDVNPGADSADKFKLIAEAYSTLSDKEKRLKFDLELERSEKHSAQSRYQTYTREARAKFQAQSKAFEEQDKAQKAKETKTSSKTQKPKAAVNKTENLLDKKVSLAGLSNTAKTVKENWIRLLQTPLPFSRKKKQNVVGSVSIIEVSVSVLDAIRGVRKTIEIAEDSGSRKISVRIPPGTCSGSVVRLRSKSAPGEELVLVVQVARHAYLSVEKKGLVVDLPVTLEEAVSGASVTVPTLEDQVILKIPPGSQSGTYIRLKERGIYGPDASRGDLFYRIMIRVPESSNPKLVSDIAGTLSPLYEHPVRSGLPRSLLSSRESS